MPNPYFQFKQFTVYHDLCAMKVGIDGVLLGAWTPVSASTCSILDIGAGSGLIALMLAQRTAAAIDAIDVDEGAIAQSNVNIANSKWRDRISVHHQSLEVYATLCTDKYDLIVANPPYFIASMKTPDEARTLARHTDSLTHEALLMHASHLLNKTGRICLILPVTEGLQCVKYAEKLSLSCYQCVYVHPKANIQAKRLLLEFGFSERLTEISKIEIESEQRHRYSDEFKTLAKDFYLNL